MAQKRVGRKIREISRVSDTILLVHLYIYNNWNLNVENIILTKKRQTNRERERESAHSFLMKLEKNPKKGWNFLHSEKTTLPLNSDIFLTNCAIISFADLGYEI